MVAGVTVAIVALPLALGFGLTSGMSAAAGLTTAIIAGFIAALFGGSRYQVSGPTGAMTVVLLPIIHSYGVKAIPFLGLLAGVLIGTSYRILNPVAIMESLRTTKSEAAVLITTALTTLLIDLIWGIGIGIVLHFLLQRVVKVPAKLESGQ